MSRLKTYWGSRGMVVAGHPDAAMAGAAALTAGGTVADAAVAAAAVLAVVVPQACSIGGDAFILVHDAKSGRTSGINASGPSPAAAVPERYAQGIPQTGPLSPNVPGVVGGWQALHGKFGRLPWSELFRNAIALAADGIAVSPGVASASAAQRAKLAGDPGSAGIFLKDGAPLAAGSRLRQPALARTLQTVAADGADAFYDGAPAAAIGRYVASRGGLLVAGDFAGYGADEAMPIETRYRDLTVRVMPPNSYGLFMLLQLNALAGLDWSRLSLESPDRLASLIGAAQAAFTVGDRAVADPAFTPEPVADLLGPKGTAKLRDAFARRSGKGAANRGGTAIVSVADAAGNACIIVQSVFLAFGSGLTDPETGVLLSNRMLGFTTAPGHPNQIGPRKRPAHTLNPVMAFAGGKLRYVLGTPGGPGQTLTLTQVLSNRVDLGLGLADAIAAPRWSMDLGADMVIEATMPTTMVDALDRRGIRTVPAQPNSPFFGSAEAIELLPDGILCGVADDRREAQALGV
jgi:gamma-glutamyltranspeptidase/glutathione hydrolase